MSVWYTTTSEISAYPQTQTSGKLENPRAVPCIRVIYPWLFRISIIARPFIKAYLETSIQITFIIELNNIQLSDFYGISPTTFNI